MATLKTAALAVVASWPRRTGRAAFLSEPRHVQHGIVQPAGWWRAPARDGPRAKFGNSGLAGLLRCCGTAAQVVPRAESRFALQTTPDSPDPTHYVSQGA